MKAIMESTQTLTEIARVLFQMFWILFRGPKRPKEILRHTLELGVNSLPIVAISTAFAGLVISGEIAWHLNLALGSVAMIPGVTGQFILRELGTAIPAFLLVSKVGASITAEIGSMKITDQIDALRLLRIQPIAYLVFPRWVACVVSTVCLSLIAIGITLLCACFMAVASYGFGWLEYINTLRHFIGGMDLLSSLVKATVFGSLIPITACVYGLRAQGGAQGVGQATTDSVVAGTLLIIVFDLLIGFAFTQVL